MKIKIEGLKKKSPRNLWQGVGYFEGSPDISASLKKSFRGSDGESFIQSRGQGGVFYVGLGKKEKYTLEKVRRVAAKWASLAKGYKLDSIGMRLDSVCGDFSLEDVVQAAAEGIFLSSYTFDKYKSKPSPKPSLENVRFSVNRPSIALGKSLRDAETICEAVSFARNLANEPANVMTPPAFAASVKTMARNHGLTCKVLGKSQIKKLGMGGILAVSQGSSFEPQFIILENKVLAKNSKPIVLVGKGITFDTGGISIKPSADMDKMKFDMCGAAAVVGTLKAVSQLKLPVKVVGLIPVCENMPGSKAQRPGDIIKCLNGKTVEVLNTDAEGRLILADALAYSKRYAPKTLIDLATLTGACAVTFSDLATGLLGTDPDLVDHLKRSGEKSGERCWELPLWDEYFELIRATYADIQNISKKNAGTITAGMFLKEFADHTKSWAHLDIAGTAWNNGGAKTLSPIGATGVGIRLLVQFLRDQPR